MRRSLLIADLGQEFEGWVGTADGKMICVAPPGITHDAEQRQAMGAVVRRAGGDCTQCKGCILGLSA